MLTTMHLQNFNRNNSLNFKSHIKKNDDFKAALRMAKNNLHTGKDPEMGINLLRAINGIENDGKHNFIAFNSAGNKVYTSINGKIDEKYTLMSTGKRWLDAKNAITNYAQENMLYFKKPLCATEEKVNKIKKELETAKKSMYAELRNQINRILY